MTKPKALAQFMLNQFKCSEDARQWLLRRSWVFESCGWLGRAWVYKRAAQELVG